jgi:hypothetical protein
MSSNDQFITVQIPESEVFGSTPPIYTSGSSDPSITDTSRKGSWFKRHLSPSSSSWKEKTIGVRMTKTEFLQYFAKDQKTGQYRKDVIEPPGGRQKWLHERIEEFSTGQLDDGAYEGNIEEDYDGLRKQSAIGKAADFLGQPYTPWALQPIPTKKKS